MRILNIIEKGITSTLAVVEKDSAKSIAQLDNTTGAILKIWELPEDDIQQYVEDYICSVY